MISNCGSDSRGQYSGDRAGDQGNEWTIKDWYSRPWTHVLRHPDQQVRDTISELAIEAANNNHIGYDQSERCTFWKQLQHVGYYPKNITVDCEADCSSGVAAIVKSTGCILNIEKLKNISPDCYTGNLRQVLSFAGFEVLTDDKYLSSDAWLMNGDILLCENHHVCTNVSDGSKVKKGKVLRLTDITFDQLYTAMKKRADFWKANNYEHGDSQSTDPARDGKTACDRGISAPLYDLGFTDQRKGGETVITFGSWFPAHGAQTITDINALEAGDIVMIRPANQPNPTADWHTFMVTAFRSATDIDKMDFGSTQRIRSGGEFKNVPVNQWVSNGKIFHCAYRFVKTSTSTQYSFIPKHAVKGTTGSGSAYLYTEVLKALGYKGVNDDNGIPQDLQLNFDWTKGDRAAMMAFQLDQFRQGNDIGHDGFVNSSEAISALLFGLSVPCKVNYIPDAAVKGKSVRLAQACIRSRGIKGADGNLLAIDGEYGPNTEYAIKAYQKAVGMNVTGKMDHATWDSLLGGL